MPSDYWIIDGKIYFSHYNNSVTEDRLYHLSLFGINGITIQYGFDFSILSITILIWFISFLIKTNPALSLILLFTSLYPLAHVIYFQMVWIHLDGSYIFTAPFYKMKQARLIIDSINDAIFK